MNAPNENMKKQVTVLTLLAGALIATPSFAGPAGCCGFDTSAMSMCPGMANHDSPAAAPSATQIKLPQQVASVFDSYSRIQTSLAKDSLEGVAKSARTMAKAANEDASGALPKNLAQQAEAVAKATDLASARKAFKPLSESLITYCAKAPRVAGYYRQVHCSMADASWLQTDSVVNNPYMGKAMARCGEFVGSGAAQNQGDHSMHMH
jgi:hypothetical protein